MLAIPFMRIKSEETALAGFTYSGTLGKEMKYDANDKLNHPRAAVVGPDGNVYIADTDNNRVKAVGEDGSP